MSTEHATRREFVATTAGAAAMLASGRSALGANEKVRLALIGAGNRGNDVMKAFLANKEVEFVAAVDVDARHAGETAARMKEARGVDAAAVKDYRAILDRKDIDAVVIATPDHWHALPAIHAVMAGKDVYCEKPVAHNVVEGKAMLAAARKYDKIMAIGTQQRSSENFQKAVEAVKSGKIGKVFWIQTWNFENISPAGMGRPDDSDPPPYIDYDRWLGPAPKKPYNINRCHLLFRWFFDYAGGMMSDWGVHLNDIALWAIDAKGPTSVTASGGIVTSDDNRDTPDTLQVVYDFPGCTLTYSMRKGNGLPMNGHGYGILFCGTDGSLMLDRSGHEIIPDKVVLPYGIRLVQGDRPIRKIDLQGSKFQAKDDGMPAHVVNFLECLKSRKRPIADIEIAHRSTNTCHLGNIAYKVGRKLNWDVETETFKDDAEANSHLYRQPRSGYELPVV